MLMNTGELNLATIEHVVLFCSGIFGGATGIGILAHMVQTFPTPKNIYWAWFLGCLQYAVGQRYRALNTMQGQDTITTGINPPQGKP